MKARQEEAASDIWSAETEAGMTENAQMKTVRFAKLRVAAVLGLLVLFMLFAPLGQGVGLSAGQGLASASDPGAIANALAAAEVQRLTDRD